MGKTNKIVIVLIVVVIFIFGILFFTVPYDSDENLVGEIEDIEDVELFMIEVARVKYFEGDYDICVHVSSSIEFQDLGIMFDYVRYVCYYNDYLIFESQGAMYITNAMFTTLDGMMIDDIAGLGGMYYERSKWNYN